MRRATFITWEQLKVGGLILAALALPVIAIVQLAGVIRDIDFLPVDADTTRNLRVVIEINQRLQPQIREDSRAKVRTLGLLGDKTLDISVGTPRYPALAPGDTLVTEESLDYEQVIAQASGAVGDMV